MGRLTKYQAFTWPSGLKDLQSFIQTANGCTWIRKLVLIVLHTLANDSCVLIVVAVLFSDGTMVALGESQLISKTQDIVQVDWERSVYARQL